MASDSKDSAFNILGSSKLNTADGKNPTSSATTSTSTQPGTASGQKNSEQYRLECSKAHDALEDRLRDEVSHFFLGFLSEYETLHDVVWSCCTLETSFADQNVPIDRNADSCTPVGEGEEVEREMVRYTKTVMSGGV